MPPLTAGREPWEGAGQGATSEPQAATRARNNWAPVVGFVLVSSANQMLWLNFAPITTGSAQRLGVSSSTIGLLAEIFPLVYVILALPVGLALDRWFRATLTVGALLTAGGAALRLGGGGFAPVFAGQIVIAVGQPAVLNAVTGVATRALREEDRPAGIAVGSAGTFLGFVLAFVLGLALGARGLHTVLVASALYSIAGAVVLLVALRLMPTVGSGRQVGLPADAGPGVVGPGVVGPGVVGPGGAAPSGSGAARWAEQRAALRAVWADPVMRSVAAIVFLGFGVFVAVTTWVQTLLQPAGVDATGADGLLVTMVVAGIVSSVVLPPTVARRRAQPLALGVAGLGAAVGCLMLAVAPGTVSGYLALGLIGLVLLPALPVLLELIEQRSGDRASTATGLLWLSGNAGGLVVALLVQLLVHHPAPAWLLMGAVTLLGIPVAIRLRRQLTAV